MLHSQSIWMAFGSTHAVSDRMSLTSWSEPSLCRNIMLLDPFQRPRNQRTLAQTAHELRFHTAIGAAIVRASLGFPSDTSEAA